MKRKLLSIVLFLAMAFNNVSAQVNLQTGAAEYSYPIFNYSDPASGLSTNVLLQYVSGNGIKVNDLASNVGLGWALGAGGFIQRIQNGEPDDQNSKELFPPTSDICTNSGSYNASNAFYQLGGNAYNYVDNYFSNGFMYTEFPVTGGMNNCTVPSELAISPRFRSDVLRKWKRSRRSLADRMQDVFIFNFNGRTGTFFIGRDSSIIVLPDSKLKIDRFQQNMLSQNIRTRISGFRITDEMGIQYTFNALELSEVMQMKSISTITNQTGIINPVITGSTQVMNAEPTGKFTVQKWLLTEIVNPRTNQKILFEYENVNMDYVALINMTLVKNNANNKAGLAIVEQRTRIVSKRLKKIITPEGHILDFIYLGELRVDEGGQQTNALTDIKYSYNNKSINSWQFNYKYFFKKELISLSEGGIKSESDKRYLRMCLTSIQKKGSDDFATLPPIKFEYYRGNESTNPNLIVPPVRCLSQDYWGYYISPAWQVLITEKYPSFGYIDALTRDQINFRAPHANSLYSQLGLIKKVSFENGGSLTFEFEQSKGSSGVNSIDGIPNIIGGVRVIKTIVSDEINTAKNKIIEYKYEKLDGSSSGWGHEPILYSLNKNMKLYFNNGNYELDGDESVNYSGASRFDIVRQGPPSLIQQMNANFLQTAKMSISDPFTAIVNFVLKILLLIFDFGPDYIEQSSTIYNFQPYSLINSLPFQYSRVVQKDISNNVSTGYVVTEFTDPTYFNTAIPAITFPFEPKMRYAPWKYGLIWKVTSYNTNNPASKVSEEENFYNNGLLEQEYVNSNFLSIKLEPNLIKSFAYYESIYDPNDITQKSFYPIRGRVELTQKKVRSYGSNGITNETITDYTYDPSNYQLKEMITKNSLGESVGTKIYYPGNYTGITGTALEIMRTQNMINIPVTTVLWKQDFGSSTKKLMQASVTEFGQISNYDIKPVNIYSSELSEPTVSTITDDVAIQNNLTNFSFLKLNSTITYDATGNPIETKAEGNRYSSVIYNYNGRLPVAKITNAKSSEISYTSFEAEGTGNWMFPNTSLTNQQSGITGSFAFNLVSTNTVTSNFYLTANSKYKLSFWVKGSKPVFTAQPPYQTTATITDNLVIKKSVSGWDFYEGEVSTNIVARIILTANGTSSNFIDELRLYPASALMVTTTYAPGIGKTSECDANNRIVYYQYDELNRLIAVRNESWDIIKAYEYKNKQ